MFVSARLRKVTVITIERMKLSNKWVLNNIVQVSLHTNKLCSLCSTLAFFMIWK